MIVAKMLKAKILDTNQTRAEINEMGNRKITERPVKPIAGSAKRSTKFILVTGIPYYCSSLYCALQITVFFFFNK